MKKTTIAVSLLISLALANKASYAQKVHTPRNTVDKIRIEAARDNGIISFKKFIKYDNSNATKEDTENWILEKLNKYASIKTLMPDICASRYPIITPPNMHHFHESEDIKGLSTRLVDDVLYIYVTKTIKTTTESATTTKEVTECTYIHLDNLKAIWLIDDELTFSAFDNTISENGRQTSYYSLKFETGKEDDIQIRFVKAFIHLEKYYWTKQDKQTF